MSKQEIVEPRESRDVDSGRTSDGQLAGWIATVDGGNKTLRAFVALMAFLIRVRKSAIGSVTIIILTA